MAGLATKFGSGAMTNSVAEIAENEALFVIGSNTTENHPIIGLRMKEAVAKGAKLIVADPRKIPLVKFATLWLRHRPGTDAVLLNAIMNAILAEGLEDKEFIAARTEGYDEFVKSLVSFTPDRGAGGGYPQGGPDLRLGEKRRNLLCHGDYPACHGHQ